MLFGGVHLFASLGHESIPVSVVVVGAIVSGVYLGLAYVLTGSLAFPIGLHLATNFADAAIFGGSAAPFGGYPAVVRLESEFPGIWEAAGGLALPFAVLTVGAVLAWAGLTRGGVAYHPSLLRAASSGEVL